MSIPSKLHNSLIGSKGRFVRSIMEECGGVHIHFPTEGSGIDKVTIRGPVEEVEKAKLQLLALAEEKVCTDSNIISSAAFDTGRRSSEAPFLAVVKVPKP